MSGPRMKPRGSPKSDSGGTGRPSMMSVNSASRPTAARDSASTRPTPLRALARGRAAGRFMILLRGAVRHERDVADVDVKVIVGHPDVGAVRTDPGERQQPSDECRVTVDAL